MNSDQSSRFGRAFRAPAFAYFLGLTAIVGNEAMNTYERLQTNHSPPVIYVIDQSVEYVDTSLVYAAAHRYGLRQKRHIEWVSPFVVDEKGQPVDSAIWANHIRTVFAQNGLHVQYAPVAPVGSVSVPLPK